MRIVICPDSFKGSLSASQAADAIERGVRTGARSVSVDTSKLPLADGGEGTVDTLVRAARGEVRRVAARDPLLRPIGSFYGLIDGGKTAVIEMAAASGLVLLGEHERNPLISSTYGTGQLIAAAIEAGADHLLIGIGGSATNDGGAGAMAALGARFLDSAGADLPPGGVALAGLAAIRTSGFRFPSEGVTVEVATDVDNPLCGPNGASAVFGPQKGATPAMVEELDAALANYARVIERDLGRDVAGLPGAGAAGGMGAGLVAFLDARLRPGVDIVLDAVDFDAVIADADLIITGEGRIDAQTARGKVIWGVLQRARGAGVPVAAIAGSVVGDISPLCEAGLISVRSLTSGSMSLEAAMTNAADLVASAAEDLVRAMESPDSTACE